MIPGSPASLGAEKGIVPNGKPNRPFQPALIRSRRGCPLPSGSVALCDDDGHVQLKSQFPLGKRGMGRFASPCELSSRRPHRATCANAAENPCASLQEARKPASALPYLDFLTEFRSGAAPGLPDRADSLDSEAGSAIRGARIRSGRAKIRPGGESYSRNAPGRGVRPRRSTRRQSAAGLGASISSRRLRASLNWRASSSMGSTRSSAARTESSVMAMAHATASVCV